MQIIDLSHTLRPDMPVYPGDAPLCLTPESTIEVAGFNVMRISFNSHTGTHLDAPAHKIRGGKTLGDLPLDRFMGKAVAADLTEIRGPSIDVADINHLASDLEECEFLLLRTGWSRFWGRDAYFSGFPALSEEAAEWLCGFGLKGIGVDTLSADLSESDDFPIHNRLLGNGMVIIENLTNLDRLPPSPFTFCCFPLKIEGGDGSPVRAAAILS